MSMEWVFIQVALLVAVTGRAIAQTQLEAFRDRPVEQLSGGERQWAFLTLAQAHPSLAVG